MRILADLVLGSGVVVGQQGVVPGPLEDSRIGFDSTIGRPLQGERIAPGAMICFAVGEKVLYVLFTWGGGGRDLIVVQILGAAPSLAGFGPLSNACSWQSKAGVVMRHKSTDSW